MYFEPVVQSPPVYLFLNNIFNLFIFGFAGSSLLRSFSLVAESRGFSLVVVHGLLITVVSLFSEHWL